MESQWNPKKKKHPLKSLQKVYTKKGAPITTGREAFSVNYLSNTCNRPTRFMVTGAYVSPEDNYSESIKAAKILSQSLNLGIAVYKGGILSPVLPGNQSLEELSKSIVAFVTGTSVYNPRKFVNGCYNMFRFTNGGCSECPSLVSCCEDLLPKSLFSSFHWEHPNSRTYWHQELTSEVGKEVLKKLPGYRYVSPSYTVEGAFPEAYPNIVDIDLDEDYEDGKRVYVQERNSRAAKSKSFGVSQCNDCVLSLWSVGEKWNYPTRYCSTGSSRYLRRLCKGKVSKKELREYIENRVISDWGKIPAWNDLGIHAAINLVGTSVTIPTMGVRGHSGFISEILRVDSLRTPQKLPLHARCVRSWSPYAEDTVLLDYLVDANPALKEDLSRPKRKIHKDARLCLAYLMASERPVRSVMFQGLTPQDYRGIEYTEREGKWVLALALTSWITLNITSLEDLHNPDLLDLVGSMRPNKVINWE